MFDSECFLFRLLFYLSPKLVFSPDRENTDSKVVGRV